MGNVDVLLGVGFGQFFIRVAFKADEAGQVSVVLSSVVSFVVWPESQLLRPLGVKADYLWPGSG